MDDAKKAGREFEKLVNILDTLRSRDGCPWDREQDERSITNFFLEEVYEAVDAIISHDAKGLSEELGDVLMEVVFLSQIFKEKKEFSISDVLEKINNKMIQRHPHVFGQKRISNSARVLDEWNKQKKKEKGRDSFFDGMVSFAPALLNSFQIGLRVSSVGFDWEQMSDVLKKVKEELSEMENAYRSKNIDEVHREIGDVLFSFANLSRHLNVNPEIALKKANERFMKRFHYVEEELEKDGKDLGEATLEEMEDLWEKAKTEVD